MNNRSRGSKLSAIASIIIIIAFFLPWVKACNQDLTGYEIATNSTGQVEDTSVYWLTLLVPIFCLTLFFFVKNTGSANRIGTAIARLVAGLIGFLPLLNIWYNVQQNRGNMEILYGGWLIVSGYVGIILSFFVDLYSSTNHGNLTDS